MLTRWSVLFYAMVSQVQPQKETQERRKKMKFIVEYSKVTSCHIGSQSDPGLGQVAEDRSKGKAEARALLGFP